VAQGCFGLHPEQVVFFRQGTMPALDRHTGRLLLADKGSLATSPNGHGGVLQALADGGHLADLASRGVRHLFYYQVDNPLVKVADPTYLGHHIEAGAEMSLKVVPRLTADEKLGVVVEADGRPRIIEYSDLQGELGGRRAPDGGLEFWAGSIAVHVFDVAFLARLAEAGAMLPFHRAVKTVPYLDDAGRPVCPGEPNAVKFEMFIFDALPQARTALVVETSRAEEFEPLKNAEGENSPATVRQAMSDLYAAWLNEAGVEVVRRADGSAAVAVEISPLLALNAEELRARGPRTGPVACPLVLDVPRRAARRRYS
jgi:UDP-N-acetylglucosamine/UDP-N-acetylgalactosamine diphosphorylase